MKSNCPDLSISSYVRVEIPTTSEFLAKWHAWIHGKVSAHYKRDKERIPDTAQRVRLRLLSKDFISRWFFKHLTNDLVDLAGAIQITGNKFINYSTAISPVHGDRYNESSIWRISDLLKHSKFDYERYFYSIQNHTIETDKFLRLMGVGSQNQNGGWEISDSDYTTLQSLYRQGRVKPAEFTEHKCSGTHTFSKSENGLCTVPGCSNKHLSRGLCRVHYREARNSNTCNECAKGRASLTQKGISLFSKWSDPNVRAQVLKLRWNDSQLTPFLREWKKSNVVKGIPRYIMRLPKEATIDAGLLKYANMVIDHDVYNHFKSMGKSDDISYLTIDVKSESTSTQDKMHWECDDDSSKTLVFIDTCASNAFSESEHKNDLFALLNRANLTDLEKIIITMVDLEEVPISDVSAKVGVPTSRVNKIRTSVIDKLRQCI